MRPFLFALFIYLILTPACQAPASLAEEEIHSYMYLSHTRHKDTEVNEIAPEILRLPLQGYDLLLLGGDLMANSTEDSQAVQYLNSVFGLSDSTTLLSVGNHDVENPALLTTVTGRPFHYIHQQDGIAFVVWDTQADSCNISGQQKAEFFNLTQNLEGVEQVVILHHKLIWMPDHPELGRQVGKVSNIGICDQPYCLMSNNFYEDLYPELVKIQAQGIPVILIAGDLGIYKKTFSYQTPEGIWFLACGIQHDDLDNSVLLFNKNMRSGELQWSFIRLDKFND